MQETRQRKKGYTIPEAFATAHNIPIATYLAYESGTDMLLTEIFEIAQYFGITMQDFFEG